MSSDSSDLSDPGDPNDAHDVGDETLYMPRPGAEPLPPPPSSWGQPASEQAASGQPGQPAREQPPYGQPGYGQPGYGQPPYPPPGYGQQSPPPNWSPYPPYPQSPGYPNGPQPPPGYYPGPMPPRRSNRGLWTACGIIAAVVVLLCIGVGIVAAVVVSRAGPAITSGAGVLATVSEFCVAEQGQDYAAAYSLLSSSAQAQMSQAAFTQASQARDAAAGTIHDCGVAPNRGNMSIHARTASITLQVTRDQQARGSVTLVLQGSRWRIESFDSALGIT